jgi:hypothetical protein
MTNPCCLLIEVALFSNLFLSLHTPITLLPLVSPNLFCQSRARPGFRLPVMAHYQYNPLGDLDIRLLCLHQGNPGDPLRASLSNVSLQSNPTYEALSYAWGDSSKCRQIRTENPAGTIAITVSLFRALSAIRHQHQDRTLWADAICIDQENDSEKCDQIPLMDRIYGGAQRVLVYLGEEDDTTELAVKLLERAKAETTDSELLRQAGLIFNDEWRALLKTLQREWFSRSWVVQEFVLAQSLVVLCGRTELPLDGLRRLPRPTEVREYGGIYLFEEARRHFQSIPSSPLWSTLIIWAGLKATKPVDILYSRLALASDRHDPAFRVDYAEPTETVFRRFAVRFLEKHSVLDYMLYEAGTRKKGPPELQSWIPNWADDSPTGLFFFDDPLRPHFHPESDYRVHGERDIDRSCRILPNCIVLKGIQVDSVLTMTHPYGYTGSGIKIPRAPDQIPFKRKAIRTAYFMCSALELYTGLPRYSDLRRLITADSISCRNDHGVEDIKNVAILSDHLVNPGRSLSKEAFLFHLENSGELWPAIDTAARGRRICLTQNGRSGLIPSDAEEGDCIFILRGGYTPFLLRRLEGQDSGYRLVGPCYIDGIMRGEATGSGCVEEDIYIF